VRGSEKLRQLPLPPGEGWGEGIRKANALIFIFPHPSLLPEGEGATTFCDTLRREKEVSFAVTGDSSCSAFGIIVRATEI
jgi:hypothetical protein